MSDAKRTALTLLSVAVVTLGIPLVIYFAHSYGEEINPSHLSFWRYETLGVGCTGSMEPTLSCRDKVKVLRNPDRDEIEEGDIIVYRAPPNCSEIMGSGSSYTINFLPVNALIIHRVVWAGTSNVRTKGDASPGWAEDPCLIPYDNIYGVVVDVQT